MARRSPAAIPGYTEDLAQPGEVLSLPQRILLRGTLRTLSECIGMEQALRVLNEMEAAGLYSRYAIGGATACAFYMEPVATYDIDVFAILPATSSPIVTLAPIYEYLTDRGYSLQDECVVIQGQPVQFLPAYNELVEEAVREATEFRYGQTPVRVIRPEHLVAIMLQTYRPKDRIRLGMFVDEVALDATYLEGVLARHGLLQQWRESRS